ncbi:hypothetical protein TrRE_jg12990 [Triparma retinervis]|uniref:Uncharacterized protein n=1 Tax=Triparma retinervis TaxID=2557542 RepID=A0A9W7EF01_9STRA|nr:hypothetical protein TrRE_jg12990 [Triparma retinervis]
MDEGFEILAAEEPEYPVDKEFSNSRKENGAHVQPPNPADLLANLLNGVFSDGLGDDSGSLSLIDDGDTGPAMCFATLLSRARMEMELAADVQRNAKKVTSSVEALLHYGNSGRLFAQAGKVGEKLEVDELILEAVRRLEITCRGNVEGLQRLIDHDELLGVVEERKQKIKGEGGGGDEKSDKRGDGGGELGTTNSSATEASAHQDQVVRKALPLPTYPSDSLQSSTRLRQAVRKGLAPIHVASNDSMTASAFMDMVAGGKKVENKQEQGQRQGEGQEKEQNRPPKKSAPNPVLAMMSLETELAHLSAELGIHSAAVKGTREGLGRTRGGRGGGPGGEGVGVGVGVKVGGKIITQRSLASSFAAAAALDGSFCVVPNSEYSRRSKGGNKGGTLVVSPASMLPRSLHQKERKHSPKSSQTSLNVSHSQPRSSPASSQEAAGIGNLLKTLQALTEENAVLLRENENMRQMKAEADEAKEFVKKFKKEYDQRFENMRNALELFKNKYPSKENPAGVAPASRMGGRESSRLDELEKRLREMGEEGAKKDAALKKYQNSKRCTNNNTNEIDNH